MVRKAPVKIVGGFVGEKEIKSAGNKIYKLIHSPEAQDLGKVALTSLIALAIGSTIKSGKGSIKPEEAPAGAPPAVERPPDELDTNPMLHWAGLGLPIKSVGEKIYDFIKSPEVKDLTPAKIKAQIIKHLVGGGIFDNIKEATSTIKKKAKQAGESIYKAITSKEAQILGATGLTLLITGILGKYAYDRRNIGLPSESMATNNFVNNVAKSTIKSVINKIDVQGNKPPLSRDIIKSPRPKINALYEFNMPTHKPPLSKFETPKDLKFFQELM